jgi:hypothetical protein
VTEALSEAQKIMDDANAKVMAAEAALASKCAVEWDKKNKKVRRRMPNARSSGTRRTRR